MAMKSQRSSDEHLEGDQEPPLHPQPLLAPHRGLEAYPVEALGPLKPVVEAVAEITGAPTEAIAQTALAVAALPIRDLCIVENLSGGVSPVLLNFMTVGMAGPRRNSADQMLGQGVLAWSKESQAEYEAALARVERARKSWDREHKRLDAERGLDRDEYEQRLEALGPKPDSPTPPAFGGGIFNLSSYGAGSPFVRRSLTRPGQREATSRILCAAFDGLPVSASPYLSEPGPLFLRVSPEEAKTILTDPLNLELGLIHRILPLRVGPASHRSVDPSQSAKREVAAFETIVHDLLKRSSGNRVRRALKVLPDALELSRAWAAKVEEQIEIGGDYEAIAQIAERGPEFAHRLGGVLTIVADPDAAEIPIEVMEHAISLINFYLEEAAQLFDESSVDDDLRIAQRLLDWLKSLGTNEVDLSTVYQRAPRPFRNKATALKFLRILQGYGHVADRGSGRWRIAAGELR